MEKSPDAFRTISEVAEWLDIPTHVLRFWESRFSQIKPVKRAGGRRYYRPSDMRLIGGVKTLLHDQGMTIRGVQKVLREQGIKHVSSFAKALDSEVADADVIEHEPTPTDAAVPAPAARETRVAETLPEEVDDTDQEDTSAEDVVNESADSQVEGQPDMFPVHASEAEDDAPAQIDEDKTVAAAIADTPEVPGVDAEDDAPGHPSSPGIAARLAGIGSSDLSKHRATLSGVKERLLSLRERLQ
ncbi:MAG: MerR family transcriptional regulator [Boseongicola sp.]